MEGCEKLVLKFPQRVLNSFLESFQIVQQLSKKTETRVLEGYYVERWNAHDPPLGPPPKDPSAIAKMRLVIMAQGNSAEITRQFDELAEDDREVLCTEMSLTGCKKQEFRTAPERSRSVGPALLVYYAPALMQKAGRSDPSKALSILAEVFRSGRQLWPFDPGAVDQTVTVRIDTLKELEASAILERQDGLSWVMDRTSGKDAVVRLIKTTGMLAATQVLMFTKHYQEKRQLFVRQVSQDTQNTSDVGRQTTDRSDRQQVPVPMTLGRRFRFVFWGSNKARQDPIPERMWDSERSMLDISGL